MIDNFNLFKREFVQGEFYFIQIIKRKKDNPNTLGINGNNHARCIKEYSIYTQEQLDKRKQEMIDIATVCNARIYIHPSRRSKDEIAKMMALLTAEHICHGWHNLSGLYRHACGLSKGTNRLRIVDVDTDKGIPGGMIQETIRQLMPDKGTDKVWQILPTKSGVHLITTPFNLQEFILSHPTIDVHKNNPTLLYYPDSGN